MSCEMQSAGIPVIALLLKIGYDITGLSRRK
jgi:hypothetical protein